MTVLLTFNVHAVTKPGEAVSVTGDSDVLGGWCPEKAVSLQKNRDTSNRAACSQGMIWSKTVSIPANSDLKYRYFIYQIPNHANNASTSLSSNDKKIVSAWETNLKAREISSQDTEVHITDEFGLYDGQQSVQSGWLCDETELQFHLHTDPITIWQPRSSQPLRIWVKFSSILPKGLISEDGSSHEISDEANPEQLFSVSTLQGNNKHKVIIQPEYGECFKESQYTIFKTRTQHAKSLSFRIDFYTSPSCTIPPDLNDASQFIGYAYILPLDTGTSNGTIRVHIASKNHKPIGSVTVRYLVIKPLDGQKFDMSSAHAYHWAHEQCCHIGHRGLGEFYKPDVQASMPENTIAAFNEAGNHGADFVELDVVLTKDHIPIVFHDYRVFLYVNHVNSQEGVDINQLVPVPIQDLNMDQVAASMPKLYHSKGKALKLADTEDKDVMPFPTLRECFERVNEQLGFNIEIKYAMMKADKSVEVETFFDMNFYVDRMLNEIIDYSGKREIILSCFDPDVCQLVRLKQNKYPVVLLTQGLCPKWVPYHDPRTQSVRDAISFAKHTELLGLHIECSELHREQNSKELIQEIKDAGLTCVVWGEDVNDHKMIDSLIKQGVHAVIYDRMDYFKPMVGGGS